MRNALRVIAGAAVILAGLLSIPASAATPCINLANQAWWVGAPVNPVFPGAHMHVEVCWPYRATVSGVVDVPVTLRMHENPGTWTSLRIHTQDQDNLSVTTLNWHPGAGDFSTSFTAHLDTTKASHDGWQEIRFLGIVKEPDGKEQHVSSGYQLNLHNGKPVFNYRGSDGLFTEARGWYTGASYTVARIDSLIPTAPITGTWSPHVHMKPGAGGAPVTFHAAYIDPDFHAGSSGITIMSGPGQFIGTIVVNLNALAPGPHKLVLRADAKISTGTSSGLLVIPFTVGGASSSPPSPTGTPVTTPSATPAATPSPTPISSSSVTPSPALTPSSSPTPTLNPCATLPPG